MAKAVTYTSASGQLTIYNARIVFEPSSYDGSEQTRRNAVLAIDEKTIDEIQTWETQIDKNRLSSALSQYGLRVKIHMDQVRMWQNQELCEMPTVLKNKQVNAIISLGGIWHTKKSSGLQLNLTDFEMRPEPEIKCPF